MTPLELLAKIQTQATSNEAWNAAAEARQFGVLAGLFRVASATKKVNAKAAMTQQQIASEVSLAVSLPVWMKLNIFATVGEGQTPLSEQSTVQVLLDAAKDGQPVPIGDPDVRAILESQALDLSEAQVTAFLGLSESPQSVGEAAGVGNPSADQINEALDLVTVNGVLIEGWKTWSPE